MEWPFWRLMKPIECGGRSLERHLALWTWVTQRLSGIALGQY